MNRIGIYPLQIEFFNTGQRLRRVALVENAFQLAIPNRIQDHAVLVAKHLFLLLIVESALRQSLRIRSSAFADAPPPHEYLCLQDLLAFARFTLHVINRAFVFYVRIETENHEYSIQQRRKSRQSSAQAIGASLDTTGCEI